MVKKAVGLERNMIGRSSRDHLFLSIAANVLDCLAILLAGTRDLFVDGSPTGRRRRGSSNFPATVVRRPVSMESFGPIAAARAECTNDVVLAGRCTKYEIAICTLMFLVWTNLYQNFVQCNLPPEFSTDGLRPSMPKFLATIIQTGSRLHPSLMKGVI